MPVKKKERRLGWREGLTSDLVMTRDFSGSHGVLWTGKDLQSCPKLRTPTSIDKSGI